MKDKQGIAKHTELSEKKKFPLLFPEPFVLPVLGRLQDTTLTVVVTRHEAWFGKHVVGTFSLSLAHAL